MICSPTSLQHQGEGSYLRSSLTKLDRSLLKVGTTLKCFCSLRRFSRGILFVNLVECIFLCNVHMVRGEVQVEQLMSDSIINLRGLSKLCKDKSRFCVSKIPYKNTRYRTEYFKQFDNIIHMNAITDSHLCSQHNDCLVTSPLSCAPHDNYST